MLLVGISVKKKIRNKGLGLRFILRASLPCPVYFNEKKPRLGNEYVFFLSQRR